MMKHGLPKQKRILSNYLSHSSLNITNIILWLIIIPYLVRVLGPAKYGAIAFCQAIIQYLIVLTDFGFNYTAPRDVALIRNDQQSLNQFHSQVFWSRFVLMAIGGIGLLALVLTVPELKPYQLLLGTTFGIVIGNVLIPTFLYQGLEIMGVLSRTMVVLKIAGTIFTFILVRSQNDYWMVPAINSLVFIVGGAFGLLFILPRQGIYFVRVTFSHVQVQLRQGFRAFVTNIGITLFTASSTIILRIFTSEALVGQYAIAERIVRTTQAALTPIVSAFYPEVARQASLNRQKAVVIIKYSYKYALLISATFSCLLFIAAEPIAGIFLGRGFEGTVIVLRILSPIPMLVATTIVFSNIYLLAFGYERFWSICTLLGGMLSILINFLLVGWQDLSLIGTSISVLVGETIIAVAALTHFGLLNRPILRNERG